MKRTFLIALMAITAVGALVGASVKAASDTDAIESSSSSTTTNAAQHAGPRGMGRGQHLDDMAELLGITADELKSKLDEGKEFYQIAVEHGVSYSTLIEKKEAAAQTKIDEMVSSGFLTEAQGQAMLEKLKASIEDGSLLDLGGRGGHGFGPMF